MEEGEISGMAMVSSKTKENKEHKFSGSEREEINSIAMLIVYEKRFLILSTCYRLLVYERRKEKRHYGIE